jgi:hypothetical protein
MAIFILQPPDLAFDNVPSSSTSAANFYEVGDRIPEGELPLQIATR